MTKGLTLSMACEKLNLIPKSDQQIIDFFQSQIKKLGMKIEESIRRCEDEAVEFINEIVKTVYFSPK